MPLIYLDPGDPVYLEGHADAPGSLGLRVRDRHTAGDLLLTAAHVVGSLAKGRPDTDRVATIGNVLIGAVHRTVPLDEEANNTDSPLACQNDAAAIRPRDNVRCRREIDGITATAVQYDLASHDFDAATIFVKRGRTTGVTRGCLMGEDADFKVKSPVGEIYYPSGLLIDSLGDDLFADAGDSGAVVIDEKGSVLGLLVATLAPTAADPSPPAFCLRIASVLDSLEVDLIGPA